MKGAKASLEAVHKVCFITQVRVGWGLFPSATAAGLQPPSG